MTLPAPYRRARLRRVAFRILFFILLPLVIIVLILTHPRRREH